MAKIGDTIRIISMYGEPQYDDKTGIIEEIGIDPYGDEYMRGTWGGCSVYTKLDKFEIINP